MRYVGEVQKERTCIGNSAVPVTSATGLLSGDNEEKYVNVPNQMRFSLFLFTFIFGIFRYQEHMK